MAERYAVIMAGGRGERFWPQSRLKRPKHLLPIVGDKPMLAQTLERLEGFVEPEKVFIITNAEQREAVLEVCPQVPAGQVVGEPVGRDTAAAVGLAAMLVKLRDPAAGFAMLPADAVIEDKEGFQEVLGAAFEAAEKQPLLVTIGIKPAYPATGYGYIHQGGKVLEAAGRPVFDVRAFVEKPDEKTAKAYLESGEYYWNAGMFVWAVATIEEAFERHTPELYDSLSAIHDRMQRGEELGPLLEEAYPKLEKISVDYAIMEKAERVAMLESAFDWDDVGEWPAIARHAEADGAGNVTRGEVVMSASKDNIVLSPDGHLTALIGVEGMIVVKTADATLICPKERAQDIKKLVKEIGGDEKHAHLM